MCGRERECAFVCEREREREEESERKSLQLAHWQIIGFDSGLTRLKINNLFLPISLCFNTSPLWTVCPCLSFSLFNVILLLDSLAADSLRRGDDHVGHEGHEDVALVHHLEICRCCCRLPCSSGNK